MIHPHGLWGAHLSPPHPMFGRLHIPGGSPVDDPTVNDPEPIGYDENGNPIYEPDPTTPP
jgi:hypothetical protein